MSVAHWSDRWCGKKWHQEEQSVSRRSLCGKMLMRHLTCRNHQEVAGPFALSSFLNQASGVYQAWCVPELFQRCGSADEFVHSWGRRQNSMLQFLGESTKFHPFSDICHEPSNTVFFQSCQEKMKCRVNGDWHVDHFSYIWFCFFLFDPYNKQFSFCLVSFNNIHVGYSWLLTTSGTKTPKWSAHIFCLIWSRKRHL